MEHWTELSRFAIGLFALLNPFTKLSYVLSTASQGGARAITSMSAAAALTMMTMLLTMHFVGEEFLKILGTSLPSFQIGGGLIILLSGISMLNEPQQQQQAEDFGKRDLGYYIRLGVAPLGIPMLAGAGAITKVVIETHPNYGIDNEIFISIIIIIDCIISGLILASSSLLMRILGPAFFSIMSRIAGLIIVAVAVEVMVKGVFAHTKLYAIG